MGPPINFCSSSSFWLTFSVLFEEGGSCFDSGNVLPDHISKPLFEFNEEFLVPRPFLDLLLPVITVLLKFVALFNRELRHLRVVPERRILFLMTKIFTHDGWRHHFITEKAFSRFDPWRNFHRSQVLWNHLTGLTSLSWRYFILCHINAERFKRLRILTIGRLYSINSLELSLLLVGCFFFAECHCPF